jgi:hypothetical protein
MLMQAFARRMTLAALSILLLLPFVASAQEPEPAAPAPPPTSPEIELNLINLPTTRSLNRHQSYFRITHRFARDLRRGDFTDLLQDLFSLDNGAYIGLEYRFAITKELQAGVNRTALGKTIDFFGRYDGLRQGESMPISLSVVGSVEALENFQEDYQPGIAAVVSRQANKWLMLYASPTFVANTRDPDILPGVGEDESSQHTFFVGLGTRIRFRPAAYLVGEYSPRLAGYDPNKAVWGAAVEFATKGHTFQINFTNAFGTLPGQIARGGSDHDIYLGFNITRRF